VISLRPATEGDADRLRAWRNDPVTRESSFSQGEIGAEEHAHWLARKLADPQTAIWIAQAAGEPVGQVRLDRLGDTTAAEVDIAVAPECRGRGHAATILRLAALEARDRLAVDRLEARVKAGNEASARSFRGAGFTELEAEEDGTLRFQLRLPSGQDDAQSS
jgi:RimJ/RimL family protein N-acetyltransferase